jgi:DNA repair protein RadC
MTSQLIVMRDEPRPYAQCPECKTRLELPLLDGERWTVRAPSDIANRLMLEMANLEQEELRAISLNAKNVVLKMTTVYRGNVSSALCRVGELYRDAVRLNASGLIVAHCHPSGDPTPSPDDLHLSAAALAAGCLLDIDLLDSIVLATGGFVSLRDQGVSFDRQIRKSSSEE